MKPVQLVLLDLLPGLAIATSEPSFGLRSGLILETSRTVFGRSAAGLAVENQAISIPVDPGAQALSLGRTDPSPKEI